MVLALGLCMTEAFFALLITQSDKILHSKPLSLSDFGYYVLAASVAGVCAILITHIIQPFSQN